MSGTSGEKSVVHDNPSRYQPRKNFLFTHPRTASNLLKRILNLSSQPNLIPDAQRDYYFISVLVHKGEKLQNREISNWTPEELAGVIDVYQRCIESIDNVARESCSQGKDVFVSEHLNWLIEPIVEVRWIQADNANMDNVNSLMIESLKEPYGKERSQLNQTVFPDKWLMSWRPTILIRHPALVFPSLYRTSVDTEGKEAASRDPRQASEMTWRWSRNLYDFYRQKYEQEPSVEDGPQWPIILDADDLINDPGVVTQYCRIVGLDPDKLKYEWSAASQGDLTKMNPVKRRMLSTLSESTGIVKGKTSAGLDIKEEAKKWKLEFGNQEGQRIETCVRAAMPDYEYLLETRLRSIP